MTIESDTNALAFSKLKALVDADGSLPEAVKTALATDLAATPPKATELRQYFEHKDAATK